MEKEILGHKRQFKNHAENPPMGFFPLLLSMLGKYKQINNAVLF